MGKTWLLQRAKSEFERKSAGDVGRFLPVIVDFSVGDVNSESVYFDRMILELSRSLLSTGGEPLATENGQEKERLLATLETFERAITIALNQVRARFEGIVFLLDECDGIAGRPWSDRAFAIMRWIKQSYHQGGRIGFVLSGFRGLREYKERVGSPLRNIAEAHFLEPLTRVECGQLLRSAAEQLNLPEVQLTSLAGGHPHICSVIARTSIRLTAKQAQVEPGRLEEECLFQLSDVFESCWRSGTDIGELRVDEQTVYGYLERDLGKTIEELRDSAGLSANRVRESVWMLLSCGVIERNGEGRFVRGSRLFEAWTLGGLMPSGFAGDEPEGVIKRALMRDYTGVWGAKVLWLSVLTLMPLATRYWSGRWSLEMSCATIIYAVYHSLGISIWLRVRSLVNGQELYDRQGARGVLEKCWRAHKCVRIIGYAVITLVVATVVTKVTLVFGEYRYRVPMPWWLYAFLGVNRNGD